MQDIDDKIEKWKKRLLELGKRNRLINFKETKRSNVSIVFPIYNELYFRIVHEEDKLSFSFPLKTIYDENGEEININVQKGDIETNKTLTEQQKTLKVLRGRAKISIEEQGVNFLYLTFGIIRWRESESSEMIISSPLVLVPVKLTNESITSPYILELHEDEIVVNPSLAFKFENDFGIILPKFDGHEDSITEYLKQIEIITKKNDWEIAFDVNLTLLSFLKINMYKDMDDNKDRIVCNPIVKALCGDKSEISVIPSELNNINHDKKVRPIDTYQVVDADSSQQDAILLSKRGISFVLQGPPGTGKSQTITNIIAESISDGKKVLFVSEKMAALEVVKKRLIEVGLGDFCLTMHSNKANKKEILNQLATSLNKKKKKLNEEVIYKLSLLEEKRNKLNEYQEQLHEKCLPLNISIYEANGRLAKLSNTQDIIFGINNIKDTDKDLLYKYKYLLSEFSKTIGRLSEDYYENPWYGCNVAVVTNELRHDIEVKLNKLCLNLKSLIYSYECITKKTGTNISLTVNNIPLFIKLLDYSSQSPIFPLEWLSEDLNILMLCAKEYLNLFYEYKEYIVNLLSRYDESILKLKASDIILNIESNTADVKSHLNNKNFTNNKDIILRTNFIISECRGIKDFIKKIDSESKVISQMLALGHINSISSIIKFKSLLELILKNPKPVKSWFNNVNMRSVNELLKTAKYEQLILKENLRIISVKYDDNILNTEYNQLLERFQDACIFVLPIIANFNNVPNILSLNNNIITSFVDNQVNKMKKYYLTIKDSFKVSIELTNFIGIRQPQTLKDLTCLLGLLSAIVQNPKPTVSWFDQNKEFIIDKTISKVKDIQEKVYQETNVLLQKYNKGIFSIDYKNILIRFNNDYTNCFKRFKSSYGADKKTIKEFSKEYNSKITDNEIIILLSKITQIKESQQWLEDNKSDIVEILGGLYAEENTNWEMVDNSRYNFNAIKEYFGVNRIPEQMEKILLENDNEKVMLHYTTLLKIIENNVLNFSESIFGPDVGTLQILELLKEMENIVKISICLNVDYNNILNYFINKNEIGNVTIDEIIEVLKSVKLVNQKRKWFSDNKVKLLENFGDNYDDENTDWDNVKKQINIVEDIIKYFGEKKIPNKLIKYFIAPKKSQDSLGMLKNDIEDINNKNIVMRVEELTNIQDTTVTSFNNIITTLECIEHGVGNAYNNYIEFSDCSRDVMQFETFMTDIMLLTRIQEIEGIVDKAFSELENKFYFEFQGMNTDWEQIITSLEYANNFNNLCEMHGLSSGYIHDVCCDKNISGWIVKYSQILKENQKNIMAEFRWFAKLFDNGEEFYYSSIYIILDRVEKGLNNLSLLEEWTDFRGIRLQCRENGLSEFVEKVEQINMKPQIIVDTFCKRFYRLWLDVMLPLHPAVYEFRSRYHQDIINEFRELDEEQLVISRLRVLQRLTSRLPDTDIATSSVDEVGILKRELTKQRKIMPLRRLFKLIPNLLTTLKPCLMMSPLSVSLFLQTDSYNFDTVIFDEASQVCTEDAIGAIIRGKQVVIAGDSNQLPPTSFFATTLCEDEFDVDDELFDDTGAYDSILEEAVNAIPERTLKWHYRSRHEDLIAFSNAKIYNNELITFPSNIEKVPDNGVEYIYVDNGIYDRGGKKHNLNEAKYVANLVFEHIRKYPKRSLGVVTFSQAQQQAIESAIRQLRFKDSKYEKNFSEDIEYPFFIKNLENVQGDERDTIIFSIGYAKDLHGVMYMNFGPLSRTGGHRRLNVAITRAKYNVKLVGSIHPTDIKIEDSNSQGIKMLRQYMEFAINGATTLQNELKFTSIVEVDSPFEEAVYDFLIKKGYNVITQVGCSGYRIDMAVKHPTISGIFVLGIECDGATYHSARTARERDRLRQAVLEDIGWTIYRIWSTDWIKDSNTEGSKLIEAVEKAISNYRKDNTSNERIRDKEVNPEDTFQIKEQYMITEESEQKDDNNRNSYNFDFYKETDVYKIARGTNDEKYISNVIDYVVRKEYPIHCELLCRRVAILFGNKKVTSKVRDSVEYILNKHLKHEIVKKGDFCWLENNKKIKVKIPNIDGEGREIKYISMEELAEAMLGIVMKSFGLSKNDLYVVTANVFGFNRTGKNITQSMENACLYLLEKGTVKEINGKIVIQNN